MATKDLKALAQELTDAEFSELVAQRCVHEAVTMMESTVNPGATIEADDVQDHAFWVLTEGLVEDVTPKIKRIIEESK